MQGVEPGKGADKAGIKPGDVIVKVNNREVTPDETLSFIVAGLQVGNKVPIELIRGGKTVTVTAEIGQRPPEDELASFAQQGGDDDDSFGPGQGQGQQQTQQAAQQLLGISVTELTPNIARQLGVAQDTKGVVITAVDASTDAGAKGLRRGDGHPAGQRRGDAQRGRSRQGGDGGQDRRAQRCAVAGAAPRQSGDLPPDPPARQITLAVTAAFQERGAGLLAPFPSWSPLAGPRAARRAQHRLPLRRRGETAATDTRLRNLM